MFCFVEIRSLNNVDRGLLMKRKMDKEMVQRVKPWSYFVSLFSNLPWWIKADNPPLWSWLTGWHLCTLIRKAISDLLARHNFWPACLCRWLHLSRDLYQAQNCRLTLQIRNYGSYDGFGLELFSGQNIYCSEIFLHWLDHVLFVWHQVWLLGSRSIQSDQMPGYRDKNELNAGNVRPGASHCQQIKR